ncbi:MAG: ABC transporter ATP-binding protein [Kiritimatiellia bacterium]|jgi:ABC-2 type transport system ATP-binding protein|nr:ABC transporter ATP-binding protein [Kiritimatiellia bacterium]MDP6809482.1 ABC transporter ATP-binding protein [Kiritimatiellia bacterium]MDP7023841.1 ABC transporter ATP-binding protein [Kiritimatiellia bacterium]
MSSVIQTQSLRKDYGTLVAVRDVSIHVDAGQVVGLIGPNGAGKTTLLRMLGTLLSPTSGSAAVLGCDVQRDYLDIRKRIGYLPDFFNLYKDLTLRECLVFFARAYGTDVTTANDRSRTALEYVNLTDKADSLIRHLSRGMVQRLGVASLIVHEPDLFLLDEPASGLDPEARIGLRRVLKKLSEEGRTVLISSHILTELSGFCSHIAIMNKGRMEVFGDVDEVQRRAAGESKVRISVLADAGKAAHIIESSDQYSLSSSDGNDLIVTAPEDRNALAMLNRQLVEAGLDVVTFATEEMSLEDVFVQISGQEDQNV